MQTVNSYDDQHMWLALHVTEVIRFARRGYQRMGRGAVQIRLAWTDPDTGRVGDRLDYRAAADVAPDGLSWFTEFGPDTVHRVATYDPETEFVTILYHTPDDEHSDAVASVHTWHVETRERQLRMLGEKAIVAVGGLPAEYRQAWGLTAAPILPEDLAEASRLAQAGASKEEAVAFFQRIVDRAIAEQDRERWN